MNFLLHLRLTEIAGLPPAGAIIGDVLRGRIDAALPQALARSIALHRRIDALSDRHPLLSAVKAGFAPQERRYAGILLDLVCDYVAANDWSHYGNTGESLQAFAGRMADAVADAEAWRISVDRPPPAAARFGRLLKTYQDIGGVDQAITRIAERLRAPQPFLDAARAWQSRIEPTAAALPAVFAGLAGVARSFSAD